MGAVCDVTGTPLRGGMLVETDVGNIRFCGVLMWSSEIDDVAVVNTLADIAVPLRDCSTVFVIPWNAVADYLTREELVCYATKYI